jgi:succinate dehydrogenase/fumarate reductase flavoprotein subunit
VGDIACSRGLVTDAQTRVLHREHNRPVSGLYAVGNDMQSMMGATYPGPGINLGPAVVFAYAAAQAATEHVGEAAQVRSPGTRTLGACQ